MTSSIRPGHLLSGASLLIHDINMQHCISLSEGILCQGSLLKHEGLILCRRVRATAALLMAVGFTNSTLTFLAFF